jgi:hypothetical protein
MDSLDVFWLVDAVDPYLDAVIIEDVPTRLSSDLSLQGIPADWALGSGTFRSWLSVWYYGCSPLLARGYCGYE